MLNDSEYMEVLRVNPKKMLDQKNFLHDFHTKRLKLNDLINAFKVCHEARRIDLSRNLVSYHNEESAILEMLEKLGMGIEWFDSIHNKKYTASYKVKRDDKLDAILNVIVINSFTKGRGRMSVLIKNPKS